MLILTILCCWWLPLRATTLAQTRSSSSSSYGLSLRRRFNFYLYFYSNWYFKLPAYEEQQQRFTPTMALSVKWPELFWDMINCTILVKTLSQVKMRNKQFWYRFSKTPLLLAVILAGDFHNWDDFSRRLLVTLVEVSLKLVHQFCSTVYNKWCAELYN